MNRAALRASVYDRLGVPTSDALLTSTVVDSAIQNAVDEINAEQDWPWLQVTGTINTAPGTGTYTPTADWLRTRELKLPDDYPLERFSIEELDGAWPSSATTGRPQAWAVDAEVLVIRPVPDAVYALTHRYIKTEADLADDAATPLMPAKFHVAIADLATFIVLGRARDDARAERALASYERHLVKMLKYRRRHKGPVRIRTRWD